MAITKIGTPELFDFSATNTSLQLQQVQQHKDLRVLVRGSGVLTLLKSMLSIGTVVRQVHGDR